MAGSARFPLARRATDRFGSQSLR